MRLKILFVIVIALQCAHSAKILGVFPMPGISHYILGSKLMKGLVEAGHDVTMISPYQLKDPPKNGKYADVLLDGLADDFKAIVSNNLFEMTLDNPLHVIDKMTNFFIGFTNKTFYHPNVKKLLQSNQKFDAVIIEQFSNDGLKVFSYIYNCPLIILSSMGATAWVNPMVGNPQPIAYVPHLLLKNFSPDSFLDRMTNLFFYITIEYLGNKYYMHPKHEQIMHKAFPNAPPLFDLYTNVSLVLLNSHTSLYDAVPTVPNMVEIGGYFIDPPKKLPKDLEDFLDSAKDGAIYFSMGSNLKSKDMSDDRKNAILKVFKKLKQKVLWKFEEDLPGKPANVMITQWCPQQDILAHPNIKLFITHGGILSTTETIYHGVPILALPVFGDQHANARKAVTSGFGLQMDYHDPNFTEEKFGFLVNEILNNPKYREDAQRRSKIYHDRPQKPMETAAYWVDYVIRHKGAPHLRVAGVRMPWYKYFMVDVIGVLLLGILIVFYSIRFLFKKLFCQGNKPTKDSKKIKKN